MDSKTRVELIRKGNELFNNGDINEALKIFVQTKYGDGITRVADYYYFDKKQPLIAIRFYKMVNRQDRVQEIYQRMMFAFAKLLGKEIGVKVDLPPPKVSPKLKIFAEEILRRNQEKEGS